MSPLPVIGTARARIRLPQAQDASALLRFRKDNRQHLSRWEPLYDESHYTPARRRQAIADGEQAAPDQGCALPMFGPDETEIIATLTFAHVVRGPFQVCLLGYGMASRWQGRGLMHEALEAGLE